MMEDNLVNDMCQSAECDVVGQSEVNTLKIIALKSSVQIDV